MLLFGSYGKHRDLVAELYPLACSNCHHITPHGLVREEKKARLYGIPVAKWGTAYQSICAVCSHMKPVTPEDAEVYTSMHLRNEPIATPQLDAAMRTHDGRAQVEAAWRDAQERFAGDPSKYVNHNLIENEDQAVAMAAFCVALLTAEELGVHPYEAYQKFLFTEGGIPANA